jgi:hypothetical protein
VIFITISWAPLPVRTGAPHIFRGQRVAGVIATGSKSVIESRVENRRRGFSLPVAVGALSRDPPQSGLAWLCFLFPLIEPDWQISRIKCARAHLMLCIVGLGPQHKQAYCRIPVIGLFHPCATNPCRSNCSASTEERPSNRLPPPRSLPGANPFDIISVLPPSESQARKWKSDIRTLTAGFFLHSCFDCVDPQRVCRIASPSTSRRAVAFSTAEGHRRNTPLEIWDLRRDARPQVEPPSTPEAA